MFKFLSIFLLSLSFLLFAQTEDLTQLEANPNDPIIIDNSDYAVLWRQLLNARESDDIETYNRILNQIQQQYSDKFLGTPINETHQILIPVDKEPITTGNLPIGTEWANELEIFQGNIGISTGGNPTPNRKMVKLIADTLGNLYAAFITNRYNADTLAFFKSTDKGFNWTNFKYIYAGPGLRYQGFDIAIADTANGKWKIGIVVSLTSIAGNGYSGGIYYADMYEDGSNFSPVLIESPDGGKGGVSPAIVSDAYNFSPSITYWYITYQRVDTTSGITQQVIAALSTNGGTSWLLDTVRSGYNDYQLDIDYALTSPMNVYVLLTNNLTTTNENLRLRYISTANFGTASTWSQYNVANTGNPEYDGQIAVNRATNQMAVVHTTSFSGQTDIQYAYSLNGLPPFTMNVPLTNSSSLDERMPSIHSPENQNGAFRVAFNIDGPGRDTIYYKATTNLANFSSTQTLVSRVNLSSGIVNPSVCGFRNLTGFAGGVVYAGYGPSNLYFNSSNLVTDVKDKFISLDNYALYQNYPNPFNPTTKIVWQTPASGWQTLKVYDVLGNEIATLVNEYKNAGRNEVEFDASKLASGLYIYTLRAGDFISSKKMMVIK